MALDNLEILFYRAFMSLLGYDPEATYERPPVRRSWPTMGQPDWSFEEDVLFYQLAFIDGQEVSREIFDIWKDKPDSEDVVRHQEQTRVLQAQLVAYGPNGAANLDVLRTKLYNGVPLLRSSGVYVVPGNEAPKYAPELFQARWWRRADMTIVFNVAKSYDTDYKTITSVPITLNANEPLGSTTVKSMDILVKKE